ncbi:TPA: hypothetical protein ACX87D_001502 [Legionella pneumophila]
MWFITPDPLQHASEKYNILELTDAGSSMNLTDPPDINKYWDLWINTEYSSIKRILSASLPFPISDAGKLTFYNPSPTKHQSPICPGAPDKIGQNIPGNSLAPRSAL